MRGQHGFTLIEVMVAILLMALVSLVAWRGLDSVSRSDAHLQAAAERNDELLRALNQLQRDLAQRATTELLEPLRPDADADALPIRSGPPALVLRGGGTGPPRLELVRVAPSRPGLLLRVRWWVEGDTLYRAASSAGSRYPLPAPGKGVAVMSGVSDFDLRTWRPGKGWTALTGTPVENPQGLELTLTRQTAQGAEHYRQVLGPFP